jgi:hypothetical protein
MSENNCCNEREDLIVQYWRDEDILDIDVTGRKSENYKHSLAHDWPLIVIDLDKSDKFLGMEIHDFSKIPNMKEVQIVQNKITLKDAKE